jgi:hypothetical protein
VIESPRHPTHLRLVCHPLQFRCCFTAECSFKAAAPAAAGPTKQLLVRRLPRRKGQRHNTAAKQLQWKGAEGEGDEDLGVLGALPGGMVGGGAGEGL